MHFKLDENIPLQLGRMLKSKGYSVSSVFSEKICGIKDKELLKICKENDYILITLDKDFANIQAYPPSKHKGIILIRLKSQGSHSIINCFERFMAQVPLLRAKNTLIIIEEENIRIRS